MTDWWDDVYKFLYDQFVPFTQKKLMEDNPFVKFSSTYTSDSAFGKQLRYYTQSVPVLGDIGRMVDNSRFINDYMNNRGLTWDDVLYPTQLNFGGGSVANTFINKSRHLFEPDAKAVDNLYR